MGAVYDRNQHPQFHAHRNFDGVYYKRLDFSSASLVVLLIIVTVIVIETISNQIRKVIL